MPSQLFWETATLGGMEYELEKANQARDEAYAALRKAEQAAKEAHEFARLIEQRRNYWKEKRGL